MALTATVVLFDIDGTLIDSGGAGARSMNQVTADLYGVTDACVGIPMAGRTDRAIVRDLFARLGLADTDEAVARLRDVYVARLRADVARGAAPEARVLPGIARVLDALHADTRFALGLLTGNFEEAAAIKLGQFGLSRYFTFGGYGDAHPDRRDLLPIALDRARARGVAASRVVVIGDTPGDVACARAHGAWAVAVTTGPYTAEALVDAGADIVLDSLEALDIDALA